jgi:hypothetical protein
MGDLRHVPSVLGRLPSQSTTGRTRFASHPPVPLDRDCEARVDPDITGTGTGPATLESTPSAHATRATRPGPLRTSVPDGGLTVTGAPGCRRCRSTVPSLFCSMCFMCVRPLLLFLLTPQL